MKSYRNMLRAAPAVLGTINGRPSRFVRPYTNFPVHTPDKCEARSLGYSLFSASQQSAFSFPHLSHQILEISCMPDQMLDQLLMLFLQPLKKKSHTVTICILVTINQGVIYPTPKPTNQPIKNWSSSET